MLNEKSDNIHRKLYSRNEILGSKNFNKPNKSKLHYRKRQQNKWIILLPLFRFSGFQFIPIQFFFFAFVFMPRFILTVKNPAKSLSSSSPSFFSTENCSFVFSFICVCSSTSMAPSSSQNSSIRVYGWTGNLAFSNAWKLK